MTNSYISFDILPSNAELPLGVEVWVNQQQIFNSEALVSTTNVRYEFPSDAELQYTLQIVLKNKLAEHTKIDSDGNILTDSVVVAQNFELEEIDITQLAYSNMLYKHNFNGTGEMIDDQFYGTMGCNGSVTMHFSAPIYVWLLDKM